MGSDWQSIDLANPTEEHAMLRAMIRSFVSEEKQKADLSGKPATFEVTVKDILEAEKSKINDELATRMGLPDLKSLKDSFASAANYINKLGWKKNDPCYLKIELNDKVPTTLLNTSAKKIKNKENLKILKKYIKDPDKIKFDENMKVAIITPDIDIIPDANLLNPAYLVFENYEIILKWNRSLRFGLAVCNLKDKFKNEI